MLDEIITDQESTLQLLRRIQFFDELTIEDLERLSNLVEFRVIAAGETIFRQGDPPQDFYVIKQGRVEILREMLDGLEIVSTLGRSGDFFGEMALIEVRPRSATVRAAQDTELLVISQSEFEDLIQQHPTIHLKVTRALSHNLRRSDARFAEKILKKNRQLAEALEELRAAQEELFQRERLSLLGKLVSGIAHDLRKPLTSVNGYAQLLAKATLTQEKRRQYSDTIIREVQRLVNMINEILRFARGEDVINRKSVQLGNWVEEVTKYLEGDFQEAKVAFVQRLEYRDAVLIDPEKFRSVFENIASNAIAAMPEGGTFTLTSRRDGKALRLEFSDTGMGMDEEVQEHVFEDFFTQRKEGTGLGMAIVKRIVEAHSGSIRVESQLGAGATFIIYLPLMDEPQRKDA